jgi:hypothetical protein
VYGRIGFFDLKSVYLLRCAFGRYQQLVRGSCCEEQNASLKYLILFDLG